MRRIFALLGLAFFVSLFVPGFFGTILILALLSLLYLAEKYARAMEEVKILTFLLEQPRTLDEIREHLLHSPLSFAEIYAAVFSGALWPSDQQLYLRLRVMSGDPVRPFHPIIGEIRFPEDSSLPVWLEICPRWVNAETLPAPLVASRREWKQTSGEPSSKYELVRDFTVSITDAGKEFLKSSGLPDDFALGGDKEESLKL